MLLNKLLRAQMKAVSKSLHLRDLGSAATLLRKALKAPKKAAAKPVRRRAVSKASLPLPSLDLSGHMPEFVQHLLTQLGVTSPAKAPLAKAPIKPVRAKRALKTVVDAAVVEVQADVQAKVLGGQFLSKSFSSAAGSLGYKLYIPSSYAGQALPLMVMLHGCTQHPDDFAQGTRMNLVADERQCFVLYPEQTRSANPMRCWNWFDTAHQKRDQGEPALIAGVTREVIAEYKLDAKKVYVAGLSAGGAMAVIMGTTYPELYAAVGVHSGMPYAAAKDVPSAFSAMKNGAAASRANRSGGSLGSLPIIVFHGDKDQTVNPVNGQQLIPDAPSVTVLQEEGKVAGGHRYTRTSHHGGDEVVRAEHWVIHGAGHAWAGGSADGTYTDAAGPDASREMMRFFYTQSGL
jgi:poly(hydroxyalkanoate) depolymerase family esterase